MNTPRHAAARRPDAQISGDAAAALQANPEIQTIDIAVKVTDGVLALTGYVRRFRDKYRSEDVVKCLPGVLAVANAIEVLPPGPELASDPELARAVVTSLQAASPGTSVRAIVRRRVVTLEGALESEAEHAQALSAVRGLRGIEAIVNLITIGCRAGCAATKPEDENPVPARTGDPAISS